MPFFHDRFSGRISLPVGGTDLFLSVILLYAISHSFLAKQGYAKSQDVKVKGLNENSFFPPIPSATGSEQDVVMEDHRKVSFMGFFVCVCLVLGGGVIIF